MNLRLPTTLLALGAFAALSIAPPPTEPYEGLQIEKIDVKVERLAPGDHKTLKEIHQKMTMKVGDSFDQNIFDEDIKKLSESYEWVEPSIKVQDHKIVISLAVKKRPFVSKFIVTGSSYSSGKILKEGELSAGMEYNRENFYQSINKIRDFLIKKGYFKAEINYKVEPLPESNFVNIELDIQEGPRGRINEILFEGFSRDEEKSLLKLIRTRKFNILTSWLTGNGTIKEEEIEPDVQSIVHYLQNEGYADAHVSMDLKDLPDNRLAVVIQANRGPKYHIRNITFAGQHLKDDSALEKASDLKKGDTFSIDKLREAQEQIRNLYTQEGYLHTHVDFTLKLVPASTEYDVEFTVEESDQYRVGLVMLSGNYCTTKNVIYNNLDIQPGEVFDSRKLKATQDKLQSTGYFKTVNVYPVQCGEEDHNGDEYCDVMVEVNEARTGSASAFVGFSSTDSIFGGVDLTENNFNLAGVARFLSEGPCALRGGGQFLQIKGTIGKKEAGVNISWIEPYWNDTLWRLGVDLEFNTNSIISNKYDFLTVGGKVTTKYPLTPHFTYGFMSRARESIIHADNLPKETDATPAQQAEDIENQHLLNIAKDGGLVAGFGLSLGYDTTDNPFKPHRGLRSAFETEFSGLIHSKAEYTSFPFLKCGLFNSYYIPLWKKATFKTRADFQFLFPLWEGRSKDVFLSERLFLGGEATVRGIAPGTVGGYFTSKEPKGGVSSGLLSFEIAQNVVKPLDIFVFFDAGAVNMRVFTLDHVFRTVGAGVRLDIGNRLPVTVGYGYPLTKVQEFQEQKVFFSMAGQF